MVTPIASHSTIALLGRDLQLHSLVFAVQLEGTLTSSGIAAILCTTVGS